MMKENWLKYSHYKETFARNDERSRPNKKNCRGDNNVDNSLKIELSSTTKLSIDLIYRQMKQTTTRNARTGMAH